MLSLGKNLEQAVAQFHCALQHTNMEPLRLFISLNLAIAYIKIGPSKESEVRQSSYSDMTVLIQHLVP